MTNIIVATTLSTIFLVSTTIAASADPKPKPDATAHNFQQPAENIEWSRIPTQKLLRELQLLRIHTHNNYEKIKTWNTSFNIETDIYLSPNFVKSAFGPRLPKLDSDALIERSNVLLECIIDDLSNKSFRKQTTSKHQLLQIDSLEPVTISGVQPIDRTSILTKERYIYFDPNFPPATYAVLNDWPEAKRKKAAHRVPLEESHGREHGELFDPRQLFNCSTPSPFWEELKVYEDSLEGKRGAKARQNMYEYFIMERGKDETGLWYRMQTELTFDDGRKNTVTSVWSQSNGFNPTSLEFSEQGKITKSIYWKWAKTDDIFIPSVVKETWRPLIPGGVNTYSRLAVLEDHTLNLPIPEEQFSYSALGLKNGDIVLDDVEQAVYTFKDGNITRLASYNSPYTPFQSPKDISLTWIVICVNAFILSIISFIILRRRFRSQTSS